MMEFHRKLLNCSVVLVLLLSTDILIKAELDVTNTGTFLKYIQTFTNQ